MENVVAMEEEFVVGLSPDSETVMIEESIRKIMGKTTVVEHLSIDEVFSAA
jgi:hypothetical protein